MKGLVRTAARATRLVRLLARLQACHGRPAPPPFRDPYRLVLLEQVAYLATDEVRAAAFAALERRVGTDPRAIAAASLDDLEAVTRMGGAVAPGVRARRLQEVAGRVLEEWRSDLRPVLRLPRRQAVRALARFPAIGEPGAERILLISGAQPILALDSNGLRVLVRLGYGVDSGNYARTYRSARTAAERELPATVAARLRAHGLLRLHGRTLCRRQRPACGSCPLGADCPSSET